MLPGFQSGLFHVSTWDGRNICLLDDVFYKTRDGTLYRLPRGLNSDGASTPSIVWPILPPNGTLYWRACVLHDYAYRSYLQKQNDAGTDWIAASLTKDQCDDLLKEAMTIDQVAQADIDRIYDGVRFGGWKSFAQDRQLP
jgi:hypothetical protein